MGSPLTPTITHRLPLPPTQKLPPLTSRSCPSAQRRSSPRVYNIAYHAVHAGMGSQYTPISPPGREQKQEQTTTTPLPSPEASFTTGTIQSPPVCKNESLEWDFPWLAKPLSSVTSLPYTHTDYASGTRGGDGGDGGAASLGYHGYQEAPYDLSRSLLDAGSLLDLLGSGGGSLSAPWSMTGTEDTGMSSCSELAPPGNLTDFLSDWSSASSCQGYYYQQQQQTTVGKVEMTSSRTTSVSDQVDIRPLDSPHLSPLGDSTVTVLESPKSAQLSFSSSCDYSSGYSTLSPPSDLESMDSPPCLQAAAEAAQPRPMAAVGPVRRGQRSPVTMTASKAEPLSCDAVKVKSLGTDHAHSTSISTAASTSAIQIATSVATGDKAATLQFRLGSMKQAAKSAAKSTMASSSLLGGTGNEKPGMGTDTPKAPTPTGTARPAVVDRSNKPSATYIEMIARALLTVSEHKMILMDIYADVLQRHPYYETAPPTWRNAIRHNLCVNDCFVKRGRSNSGRGFFWAIHPACVDMFAKGDFRRIQARRLAQQMDAVTRSAATARAAATQQAPPNQVVRMAPVATPSGVHYAQQRMLATPTGSYPGVPAYGGQPSYGGYYGADSAPQMGGNYQYYSEQHMYACPAPVAPTGCQSYYATPTYR